MYEVDRLRQLHGCQLPGMLMRVCCCTTRLGWRALCKAVLLVCSRTTLMQSSTLLHPLPLNVAKCAEG